MKDEPAFHQISGRFWRAIAADRVNEVLQVPSPVNAGRYHRPGQPALYITPHVDWATIAIGRYLLSDGIARVAVPLKLTGALVFDQRDPTACAALGVDPEQSQVRWNDELAAGREPPSWAASDAARAAGAQGIIDASRGIAGLHLKAGRFPITSRGAKLAPHSENVPCATK